CALVRGERTVKKLRLSKALTIPEGTTVYDASRRMAAGESTRCCSLMPKASIWHMIAEGLRVEQTIMSKIMTESYLCLHDSLAIEALQKMVQGKFRHLPVVENGQLNKGVDSSCSRGVERQLGGNFTAPYAFIETLRERMFKPSLSTIVTEGTKVAIISPSDPVYVATQKMREFRVNSVVVTTGNTVQGIFTSKDVLMRVVSQNLSPELTLVEKVMTANPDCATLDTTILDALHIMHDGKFLHIPVLDREGQIAACLDVLQLTHAAIQLGNGTANGVANSVMQRFWDSNEASLLMASEAGDGRSSIYPPIIGNSFPFKLQDRKGRVHRFTCGSESLDELVSSVRQRLSIIDEKDIIQILYEDDEGDRVLLTTDTDLAGAVLHAKSSGLKVLKLHIEDESNPNTEAVKPLQELAPRSRNGVSSVKIGLMAGAVALSGTAVMVYLKRSRV
ncbi:hypothetical protein ZWY2020_019716, partial [Hordeum vulgare]